MTTSSTKILVAVIALGLSTALDVLAQERRASTPPANDLDRAYAAFKAGHNAEALTAARRAADTSPISVRALTARAGMAEFMGEFDEARTYYERVGALAPDDAEIVYRRASFAVRVGEYDRALAQLDRLLALHPRHVRWLFQWAPTRLQASLLHDHPSLERIVQIKLDILTEKGDLEQARRLARAYGIVQPGMNYCAHARQLASSKRDEIFQAFRLAALGQPDAADCIWWYGQWLSDEGYVRLGRLMVLEGTRITPSAANRESGARYVRIRLGGNREISKRAEQIFLIARQRYLRDGDLEGAVRLFDESIRLAPGFARPYNYRATIAAELGDLEGALAWLQRGLKADTDSWRTHRNLGKLFSRLERYPEAEMHLRTAVELFADDAGGRLALARVLYAQGKYDEFAKEARAAVAFLAGWKEQISDVREFLARFDRWGPGAALPPAPDPHVIIGWNHD
jgi:tetratricopeptide (TPR) repeat protein